MKTMVAFLTSAFTAVLTVWLMRGSPVTPPLPLPQVLTVRELRVVDDAGVVRMRLHTEIPWRTAAIDLMTADRSQPATSLSLDQNGKGTLAFNSADTDTKVMVGHFLTGDVVPPSLSDHSWGIRVLNLKAVKGAPRELYLAASEGGNAAVSRTDEPQGLPPDAARTVTVLPAFK